MQVKNSVLELIGNTPMVKLNRITSCIKANIFVKLEYLNPSGSLKDRIALRMIEEAEKEGKLKRGYKIVEASTGNTGTSISFVGTLKGYSVTIYETNPGKMGEEKRKIMSNFGAVVKNIVKDDLISLKERSVAGAEIELPGRRICLEMEKSDKMTWWARQFSNPNNVLAHNELGREIIYQTDGKIDAFVASIGTGGTLMGIAEVLKKEIPRIKIVGIQPSSSRDIIKPGQPYPRTDVSGGIISDMMDVPNLIDEVVRVSDDEAVKMTHRLWRKEGIFAGVSSGANVFVALQEAEKLGKNKSVVTILPDSGDRYLTEEHYVT